MTSGLLQFLVRIVILLALVAFHLLVAKVIVDRSYNLHPGLRRWIRYALAAGIVFLDLPLLHAFVIYKFYHPLLLDHVMKAISPMLMLLHLNVAAIGGLILAVRFVIGPIRRRLRMRAAPAPAFLPALAGSGNLSATAAEPVADAGSEQAIPARRRFVQTTALALTGYITSSKTLSAMGSSVQHRLERVVIRVPGLPEAFKGTTIAMLADIHSSVFMTRDDMETYAAHLQALKADMIFIVGDFVNSKVVEVYPMAEAFSRLSAPLGVYGVTGNHDYYSKDIETIVREVSQAGIRLLRDENLVIEKGGEKLWLMGMDDDHIYDINSYLETGKTERGSIENMLKGIPDGAPRLFLCHKPYPFEEYSRLGIDVMVSGHTHGGQVVLAPLDNVNLSFASLASRYLAGLYRSRTNRHSQLYVTRGIGTVGIPLRLNCPPEVTHITLV
jgi:predicted MPP superfamily phosphohydrolase